MPELQLTFLTEDTKSIDICNHYWAVDTDLKFKHSVASVTNTFGLKSNQVSKLVAEYCNAHFENFTCEICDKPYIFSNRSDFQRWQRYPNNLWVCSDCKQAEQQRKIEEQKVLQQQKQFIIGEEFALEKRQRAIEINSLSLEDAVYLLSFIRLGASENLDIVKAFESTSKLLAPSQEYSYEIIKQLFQNNLIFVHPDSPPEAFVFDGIKIPQFYTGYVMWALPIVDFTSENSIELVTTLEEMFRTMDWPDNWHAQWPALWQRIALEESLEYLLMSLEDHGFSFTPGEKTILVLKNVLAGFSVSQAYNMIWRAARDAAAFYVRENVPKKHAANTVVGSIQRYAERAKAEGWEVKKYGRDRRCPQSLISQVLFNTVLQIGDDGFNEPPPNQE